MNAINIRKSSPVRALQFGVMALLLCTAMPNAWAQEHKPDPTNSKPPANNPLAVGDTSKPDSASVVKRFANVSRVFSDDRGYIYILSDDGRWVISKPTAYPQDQLKPFQTFWACVEYAHEAQAPCTQGY